jgi:hypothetical protein
MDGASRSFNTTLSIAPPIFCANPDRFSVKIVDSAQNTRAKPRIPLTNL